MVSDTRVLLVTSIAFKPYFTGYCSLFVVNDALVFAGPFGLEGACSKINCSNRG